MEDHRHRIMPLEIGEEQEEAYTRALTPAETAAIVPTPGGDEEDVLFAELPEPQEVQPSLLARTARAAGAIITWIGNDMGAGVQNHAGPRDI